MLKLGTTWSNTVGDGVTATSVNTSGGSFSSGINAIDLSAFNATQVERYFVEFNTSGVTSTPTSATFKLYGTGNNSADVICVQASFASNGAIVTDDWDSWNESSPVTYTDEISSWNNNGYNNFTLTAAGLSAMVSLNYFQMVCLEADNDYDQSSAGSGLSIRSGYRTNDYSDASNRPVLSYSLPSSPPTFNIKSGEVIIKGGKLTIK
tara:strand:- start:752 stop:1372 length:621 start_codon:yes stop_codon:yes gene_type:complete